MKFFNIFKKQGGIKLVINYFQTGILPIVCCEIIMLGCKQKALEILRLIIKYKIKFKLERKYRKKIIELEKRYDNTFSRNKSNVVWVCWFQGINNAPDIVKVCYKSLKENLIDKDIILITYENMEEYVTFPTYILDKWKNGNITNTHMTDLLRLELLNKYGGTWIDATVYCTSKSQDIPKYFFEDELFLFQTLKPGRDGESLFISSWFITANPNNKVLWITKELIYEYWKKNNKLIDYFLIHYFICMVLEFYPEVWNLITPRDNSTPHILLLRLFEKYDSKLWKSIKEQTPFHKLSYKFKEEDINLDNTYYKNIIDNN